MELELTNHNTVLFDEVNELLQFYAKDTKAKYTIAPLVAGRSLMMNHLYQDLGFGSRTQMGKFMAEHFPKLANEKPKDKLWKKFIYDKIGRIAPACATCLDQESCFSCQVG